MTTARTQDGLALRVARPQDFSAVQELLVASSLPLDGVEEALEHFQLAEADGQLVAVGGLEIRGAYALLRSVAVHPDWRSRGLGRRIVERLIAEADARQLRGLYLLTTTAADYFPHFGFERVTREMVPPELRGTAEFQGACPASATVMRREAVSS
jgi:amino-acid N-acetyltransferase